MVDHLPAAALEGRPLNTRAARSRTQVHDLGREKRAGLGAEDANACLFASVGLRPAWV